MSEDGQFINHLLLFGRVLHNSGLDVNPHQMVGLVQALDHIQISNKPDFYHACRSILVHHKKEIGIFDQIFETYWRHPTKHSMAMNLPGSSQVGINKTKLEERIELISKISTSDKSNDDEMQFKISTSKTYSSREVLRQKDFAHLSLDEIEEVKRLMRNLVLRIDKRRSRRWRFAGRKRDDLRRTLRKSIQFGGSILEWVRLDPKWKPRPIVVLADVSGSMEKYTEMLIYFLLSLSTNLKFVEAFVFSTQLTRITPHLHIADIDKSLQDISRSVPDWSGGTRIGEAIKTFNYRWSRRILNHGAIVMVISDGWDRGEPELLTKEIARLQRSCHRLIWLNPLLGIQAYEPLTRGIQAALRFIDDFLPVHNLSSLEKLESHLRTLPTSRAFRSQQHLGTIRQEGSPRSTSSLENRPA